MSEPDISKPTPWYPGDLKPEDRVPDDRPKCTVCAGAGRVREWSTPFAMIALAGFAGGGWQLYRMLFLGHTASPNPLLLIFLVCLGFFGLFVLVDRGECKACDGFGIIEPDDHDDTRDEPSDDEPSDDEPT
jgi:hypothetical protein